MSKLTFLGAVSVLWLFMNYLLYQKEISPFLEYEEPPSYEAILKDKRSGEVSKWGFYEGTERLGELTTTITPNSEGYQIYTNVDFAISATASQGLLYGKIISIVQTNVDDKFQLIDSNIITRYPAFNIEMGVKCKRKGEKLHFEYYTPIGSGEDTIDFPKEATLASDFLPIYGTDKLKIGKKWELKMTNFDFLSGSIKPIPLYVSVEAKEEHLWQDKKVDAYRVEIKKAPTKNLSLYTLWITEDGTVIEQQFWFNNSHYFLRLEEKKPL